MYLEIRERGSNKLISDKLITAYFGGHLPQKNDIINISAKQCKEPYNEKGYKGMVTQREFINCNTCILKVF